MSTAVPIPDAIEYPTSDGRPMAESTRQYQWIVALQGNLDIWFRDDPAVFIAGNNLIYAEKGKPKRRRGPDVYVAVGRPKGHRGSYQVWKEGGLFPQVIFEVLSPGNRAEEMRKKKLFYEHYGAEEYYVVDSVPDVPTVEIWLRVNGKFVPQQPNGFVSPRLKIRFEPSPTELAVYLPDGRRFLTLVEIGAKGEAETARANQEKRRADTAVRRAKKQEERTEQERERADAEKQRAEAAVTRAEQVATRAEREIQGARQAADEANARADKLAAKLRALGLDPDNGGQPS